MEERKKGRKEKKKERKGKEKGKGKVNTGYGSLSFSNINFVVLAKFQPMDTKTSAPY